MRIAEARGCGSPRRPTEHGELRAAPAPRLGRPAGRTADWHAGARAGSTGAIRQRPPACVRAHVLAFRPTGWRSAPMHRRWLAWSRRALPDGARVLSAEGEFTSALWPFMAQGRGVEVRAVPLAELAEALDAGTDAVAFSAVQSSDGRLADLDAIAAAAAEHGALTVVDATQACGWLPLDATRFDVVVCSAYKWLLSPRGSAFMTVRPERRGAAHAARSGLVCGRRPARLVLRRAAAAGARDASLRREPGLVLLGGDGPGGRAARRDRGRADPRARSAARQRLPRGLRPRAGRLGDRRGRDRGRGGAPRGRGDGRGALPPPHLLRTSTTRRDVERALEVPPARAALPRPS